LPQLSVNKKHACAAHEKEEREKQMKQAIVIYHSSTGTTKKFGEEIGEYLNSKGIDAHVTSTTVFREEMLNGVDYLLFGCWTSGLMIMLQKPEQSWVEFAEKLPSKKDTKVALFTTYKILTGSMFRNMYKELKGKFAPPTLELKARGQILSEKNRQDLDRFIS
jgi:flavodoxin